MRSSPQKRVVNVYRLITRGTLEEKIMGLQKFKMSIANTVISQENASLQSMGTDQLLNLFTLDRVSAHVIARAACGCPCESTTHPQLMHLHGLTVPCFLCSLRDVGVMNMTFTQECIHKYIHAYACIHSHI